jgi:hypothetical protein
MSNNPAQEIVVVQEEDAKKIGSRGIPIVQRKTTHLHRIHVHEGGQA